MDHPWVETFQGYAEAERWTRAERWEWLRSLKPEEAWEIFDALYGSGNRPEAAPEETGARWSAAE
ncbi:MAG: hypothetical protein H5T61_11550 [Thermoflexales bacterium]|nr:hypothetical protein [Thermoflexales bacterium]